MNRAAPKTTKRTPTTPTRAPRTNRGNCGQGSNWIARSTRLAVYERDGWCCAYCQRKVRSGRGTKGTGANVAHLDHVVPVSRGGSSRPDNLVTCCARCNALKHNRTADEYLGSAPAKLVTVFALLAAPIDRARGRALEAKGL